MKKAFLFLLAFISGRCLPAWADMYAVENIPVDVTAENASMAKEQAVLEAQEKAFYKMLERLTLASDMESLPALSNEDILNLVQDFSVANEKTSNIRYMASVTVQFNPEAIQAFFQEYKVPYITSVAEKRLIIPMIKKEGDVAFQSEVENNAWYNAWKDVVPKSDLVPLVLPSGDADDAPFLTKEAFTHEYDLDMAPLLEKYKASKVLILEAVINNEDGSVKISARPFQNEKDTFADMTLTEPFNASLDNVLKRAAERTLYLLEQRWREKTAVRFDNPTLLSVVVPIQNLGQWITIRAQLDNVKLIKQYLVKAVRKDKAQIELFYAGSLPDFIENLKQEGLFLDQVENSTEWRLRELNNVPAEERTAQISEETLSEQPVDVEEDIDEENIVPTEKTPSIQPMVFEREMGIVSQTQPETFEILDGPNNAGPIDPLQGMTDAMSSGEAVVEDIPQTEPLLNEGEQ